MIFKAWDSGVFERSTHCHICKGPLTPDSKTDDTVKDHCHFTGKFRGAAHNNCNLNYRKPKFFLVIFNNLAGYDSHLFKDEQTFEVKRELRLIDSFKFMAAGFSKLVSNLTDYPELSKFSKEISFKFS